MSRHFEDVIKTILDTMSKDVLCLNFWQACWIFENSKFIKSK